MSQTENKVRIAVLVSGGGTNLQALIDAEQSNLLPHGKIVCVISSNNNAYALTRASKAGIATKTISRKDCVSQQIFEQRIKDALAECDAELIVLAGFMCILSSDFTCEYPERIINVHPSLIPSFCGKGFFGIKVHEAALDYGVKVTGATVHFVNEIPDGGRIIMQQAVYVKPDDTPHTLQRRVMEQAEWKILPQATETVAKELSEHLR